jgi:serine/threonine-protein kinase ATR
MPAVVLPTNERDFFLALYVKIRLQDTNLVYTYTIEDTPHAIQHLYILLSMLVEISVEAGTLYDATSAFEDYIAWLIDTFSAMHELHKRLKSIPKLQDAMALCAMQVLLLLVNRSMPEVIQRKGSMTLSILLADILNTPSRQYSEFTAVGIRDSIIILIESCHKHSSIYRYVSLHLAPIVNKLLEEDDGLKTLGLDLKVSTTSTSDL